MQFLEFAQACDELHRSIGDPATAGKVELAQLRAALHDGTDAFVGQLLAPTQRQAFQPLHPRDDRKARVRDLGDLRQIQNFTLTQSGEPAQADVSEESASKEIELFQPDQGCKMDDSLVGDFVA